MMLKRWMLARTLPLALALGAAPAVHADGTYVPGQFVIKLKPGESIASLNASYCTKVIASVAGQDLFLLQLPPQVSAQTFSAKIIGDARVAWAEMNFVIVAPGGGTQSFFVSGSKFDLKGQYAHTLLKLDQAHAISTGQGSAVAILDTGVWAAHEFLAGSVLPGGYNFVDDNGDTNDVGNGIDDNNNGLIDEMTGHGTFIAGLVIQTAPDAMVLPVKVLNSDGVGSSFYAAQGIHHAISAGVDVVNMSFTSIKKSLVVQEAAAAAGAAGLALVACVANNDKQDPASYPAAFPGILAVAATDQDDLKAVFSDYGPYIDLSAPGAAIASIAPDNTYAWSDGASLSAGFVSGAAALLRAKGATTIAPALKGSAADLNAANPLFAGLLGAGRLDPAAALGVKPCDFNGDGKLNIEDFIAFQLAFALQLPGADFNGDGKFNIEDFIAFQLAFALGCP